MWILLFRDCEDRQIIDAQFMACIYIKVYMYKIYMEKNIIIVEK